MWLVGMLRREIHLLLSLRNAMINLSITESEFERILILLKLSGEFDLYNKLWAYNFRIKYQQKEN